MRIFVLFLFSFSLLGGCSSTNRISTLDTIREAHTHIRSAFIEADNYLSELYEEAGERCFPASSSRQEWDECMRQWNQVEVFISVTRELLTGAELVYDSIEAGRDEYRNLAFVFRQILLHTQSILRILNELNISTEVLNTVSNFIEVVCQIVNCENEGS